MTRVLVVDDEFGIVEALEALLTDEGFAVVVARNGAEGLEQAKLQPPDVCIVDLMMPVMPGDKMVEALRADPQLARLPVIFMSAAMRTDLVVRLKAVAFLRKPFALKEVLRAIEKALATP